MELLIPEPAAAPAEESLSRRPDPYAIGPDTHERARDEADTADGSDGSAGADGSAGSDEDAEPVTDKGLPKRTPRITTPAAPPPRRGGTVDAEALRRRLGGFRKGAEAGYRDVEAEIAERTGQNKAPDTPAEARTESEAATGGTVEEASS